MLNHNFSNVISNNITYVPVDRPGICAFSGGKDSGLALAMALESSTLKELVFFDDDEDSDISHIQPREIMMKQAELIGLPICFIKCNPLQYGLKYTHIMKDYKERGFGYIVYGNIGKRLVSYKAQITEVGGLLPVMPLYQISDENYLKKLKEHNIKSVITSIKPPIEKEWLGEFFDDDAYYHFKDLGIDPQGGLGVFHTILIDANFFKAPLPYKIESNNGSRIRLRIV